jgi:RNA polymerase sigma-70 factor (ECF subfamily)
VSESARARLLERFFAALRAEDHGALLALFAQDATWTSDGGGKAKAARKMVQGGERVARFAAGVFGRSLDRLSHELVSINGEPGLLLRVGGRLISAISIDTDGERILAVYAVLNPDKLRGIG